MKDIEYPPPDNKKQIKEKLQRDINRYPRIVFSFDCSSKLRIYVFSKIREGFPNSFMSALLGNLIDYD